MTSVLMCLCGVPVPPPPRKPANIPMFHSYGKPLPFIFKPIGVSHALASGAGVGGSPKFLSKNNQVVRRQVVWWKVHEHGFLSTLHFAPGSAHFQFLDFEQVT